MNKNKRNTIFTRMMIWVLLPLVFVLFALLVYVSYTVYEEAKQEAQEKITEFAYYTSQSVNSTYVSLIDTIKMTGKVIENIDFSQDSAKNEINKIMSLFLSENENVYCTWYKVEPGIFSAKRYSRDWIRENGKVAEVFGLDDEYLIQSGEALWYTVPLLYDEVFFDSIDYYDFGNGYMYTSSVGVPIHYNGEVIGVIGMDIRFMDTFDYLKELENENRLFLINHHGQILYTSDKSLQDQTITQLLNGSDKDIVDRMIAGKSYQKERDSLLFGKRSFIYVYPVALLNAVDPIFLYVDMPTDVLYRNAQTITKSIVFFGSLALMTIAICVYIFANRLTEPIDKLTKMANEISDGNLDVQLDLVYNQNLEELTILQSALFKMIMQLNENIREKGHTQDAIINILANTTELRDNETGAHLNRTTEYVRLIVERLKETGKYDLSEDYATSIIKAAKLHDIGKVGIEDSILLKPGRLTLDEFKRMKEHTTIGASMIEKAMKDLTDESKSLATAKEVVHYHHERWDGNGYPKGLKGEEIPLSSRIMAIADVYDALISRRTYKDPFSHDVAMTILKNDTGVYFDPNIMKLCADIFDQFAVIADTHRDEEK